MKVIVKRVGPVTKERIGLVKRLTMALDDFVDCDPIVCVPRVQFLCSFFVVMGCSNRELK